MTMAPMSSPEPRRGTLLKTCLWLGVLLAMTGCWGTTTAEQRYYTLSLPAAMPKAETRRQAELLVREVEISPIYNRPQIVYRYSPQELQFFRQNNWADRPSRMIGQLLVKAVSDAGIFRTVVERMGAAAPAYVLDTNVEAIEELQGGDVWFAHLAMTWRLARFEDNLTVWQFSFDERRPLARQELAQVVRAMSEILDEQLRIALPQLEAALAGRSPPADPSKSGSPRAPPPAPPPVAPPPTAGPPTPDPQAAGPLADPASSVALPSPATLPNPATQPTPATQPKSATPPFSAPPGKSAAAPAAPTSFDGTNGTHVNWRLNTQYTSDPASVPAGKGAIFLPSLSLKPDREPPVTVLQGRQVVARGAMGRRISVAPGQYRVTFGSGPEVQHLSRQVEVVEGQTSIISPDWAVLDVSVVNAKFIPFLGTYELIRMDDREYMGVGYGVDEELGQQTRVWLLRPGLYKLVQAGSTYRARINFSTVRLIPGMAVPFTLVQDEITRDFLGAGVAEPEPALGTRRQLEAAGKWTLRTSLGGSVLLNHRTEGFSSAPVGSSVGLDLFADGRLRFVSDPHVWATRLEVEEGQMLQPTLRADNTPGDLLDGRLQSVKDRLYFNSIYTYQYLPWVGPYLRLGGETSLFQRLVYFEKPTVVVVRRSDGPVATTHSGADGKGETAFTLASPLMPIQLKQGAGANFRLLHNAFVDLDIRGGLGARQYLARDQLVLQDDAATTALELRRVASSFLSGLELSALGQVRLTRYLQASTELDTLVPFSGTADTQMTWRSAVSLRLSSFAALTYALNLLRQPNVRPDLPFATEQGLQLRFFYAPW
jgi:ABC-type uncharacterized transport system auxiliary subunit